MDKVETIDPRNVPICQDLLNVIRQSEDKEDETSLQIIVEQMQVFYKKMKLTYFFRVYRDTLIVCFTYQNNLKAVNVTRLLGMFAVDLIRTNPDCEKFTLLLMMSLYELSMNQYVHIKIKTCQFTGYFVKEWNEPINLPVSFRDKIRTIMLEKLTMETSLELRKEAANVACRFQNPEDPNCPAVKWICTLISGDLSSEIRKYLLPLLAVPNNYMDICVTATNDSDDDVRTAAYKVFRKVPMGELNSIDRTMIIFNGLYDDCENVRMEVKKVLEIWLRSLESNNLAIFLKYFDIQFKPSERVDILLNAIFEISNVKNISKELLPLLNDDRVIPAEKLDFYNVLVWKHFLVYYANSMQKVAKYFKIPDYDNLVAEGINITLVPDMIVLCKLIREYYLNDERCSIPNPTEEREKKTHFWFHYFREFTLCSLLRMFDLNKLSDEVGRKELHKLLFELLSFGRLKKITIPLITNLYLKSSQGIDDGISRIMKVINKLCIESINRMADKEVSENNRAEKGMLFNAVDQREPSKEDVEEVIKKVPMGILVKCMLMVMEMMQSKEITEIDPKLNMLFKQFVLTVVKVHGHNNKITPHCSVVLSSFCLRDEELALKYTNLFVSWMESDEKSRFKYSKCVFDMFVKYDFAQLPYPERQTPSRSANTEMNENMHPTFVHLLSLYDESEDPQFLEECILGLCKMLLTYKTKSPTVLSKILLFQIDPSNREFNTHLQASCIPLFLNHFRKNADYAIGILAEAFLIVLKKIADKNEADSIFELDAEQFVNKMPPFINEVITDCKEKRKLDEVEYKLAKDICEELLRTKSKIARKRLLKIILILKMDHIRLSKLSLISQRIRYLREKLRKNEDNAYEDIINHVMNKVGELRGITLDPDIASDNEVQEEEAEEEEFGRFEDGGEDVGFGEEEQFADFVEGEEVNELVEEEEVNELVEEEEVNELVEGEEFNEFVEEEESNEFVEDPDLGDVSDELSNIM